MSTKILCWNIQNFTINKIDFSSDNNELIKIPTTGESYMFTGSITIKNNYILNNVETSDPDIFIVIEVISGRGSKGSLVSSKGAQGALTLLDRLRVINNNWCLVPPQKLTNEVQLSDADGDENAVTLLSEGGYTEAIAVYYRKDKLDFIGPFVWPDTADSPAKTAVAPGAGVTPGAYPDIFSNCLPAGNYFAGQTVFKTTADVPKEIYFPAETSRRPFLTCFTEKAGLQRKLSIASVHYPPQAPNAKTALVQTLKYFTECYVMIPNEVNIIIGDFNVDYNNDNLNIFGTAKVLFNYYPLFTDRNQTTGTIYYNKRYATYKKYIKSSGLDNALLRYGSQGAYGMAPVGLVLDRVNVSALGQLSQMYNSYAQIGTLPQLQQDEVFLKPFNYPGLGPAPGTSDHLAIYVEL